MNRSEARRWAYGMAAHLLITGIDSTDALPENDQDREIKKDEIMKIIKRLRAKGDDPESDGER